MSKFSENKEWQWLFENAINWVKILPLYYPKYPTEDELTSPEEVKSFLKELADTTAEWCENTVAPRAEKLDKEGAGKLENGRTIPGECLSALYKEAQELGGFGLCAAREHGGLEAPVTIGMLLLTQLSKGCIASSIQIGFFGSIADMIERFCDEETKKKYIPQIINGEISGSMCLTEPGCGSDLGSLKTSAKKQADGTYLLNGTKIFISNGGGGLGFVLARIDGAPEGLDGISMFLVDMDEKNPAKEGQSNFRVGKVEEKLGVHGSFTCEIVYENTRAHLVGEENTGFKMMLHLMNECRIGTALQALGCTEASYYYAKKYADERMAFGKPISQLPLLKRNLEDYETEVDAIRALLIDTLSHYDIYQRLDLKKRNTNDLTEEEEKLYQDAILWTRKRTPLVKYYATEACTTLTQKSIQVLGGFGFMSEYPVERLHRDSFAPLLYEGTSQIQALMALKDVVKYAIKDPKKFFGNIFYKHPTLELLNKSNEWSWEYKTTHYRFKKKMVGLLFTTLKPETEEMFTPSSWTKIDEEKVGELMIHAETLCQALSYMETLRVLCEHANKDESRADLFHRYQKLITPRLEAIYSDWSVRT